MKIYIMTDLEGVAGVAVDQQITPSTHPAYLKACRWLTQEVNAAIAGAFAAGADAEDIIVNDGHSAGFNIVLDELDPRVRCLFGRPSPEWLPLLNRTVDAVLIVGQHAMARTKGAVRDHTQSSQSWSRFTLNGREMGELGQIAALAGSVGVPIAMVTGDDKTCAEARRLLGRVETVQVKAGLSRECALTVTPVRSCELIRAGAERALDRLGGLKPYRLKPPFTATLELTSTMLADRYKDIPGRRRIGPRTLRFTARSLKGLFALIF